jgi:hypothetical protein
MNTIHAQLKIKLGKIVDVEIPTDEEIERIAIRMHKHGKPCLETILGWNVIYRPRENFSHSVTRFNPFTNEQGEKSALKTLQLLLNLPLATMLRGALFCDGAKAMTNRQHGFVMRTNLLDQPSRHLLKITISVNSFKTFRPA